MPWPNSCTFVPLLCKQANTALSHFPHSAAHKKTPPRDGVSCGVDEPVDVQQSLPLWANSYSFTGSLRPCLLSPRRTVPSSIRKPDYADHPLGASLSEQRDRGSKIHVYTEAELKAPDDPTGLRHACRMGREVLDLAGKALRVGVTTDEIDRVVHEAAMERNVYPSPLNYYNFPKSVRDVGRKELATHRWHSHCRYVRV